MFKKLITLIIMVFATASTFAQITDSISINLENVKYAHPVKYFNITAEGQDLKMPTWMFSLRRTRTAGR